MEPVLEKLMNDQCVKTCMRFCAEFDIGYTPYIDLSREMDKIGGEILEG